MSSALCATDLEGKQFSDAKVKILTKKKKVYQTIFIRVALNMFHDMFKNKSAFQCQTSSHALLN